MIITSSQLAKACIELTNKYDDAKKTADKFKQLLKERPVLLSSLASVKASLHKEIERINQENQIQYIVADKEHVTDELIKESLKKVLGESFLDYQLIVRPELIGGLIIHHQGHVYDFSVSTIINKLSTDLAA